MLRNTTIPGRSVARASGLALATSLLAAPALAADAPDLLHDPFDVSLGTFLVQTDPTVQLDGDAATGQPVDFSSQIGGADSTRFRLDGAWRFGDTDRHRIKGFLFDVNRSRKVTVDQDIDWGGNTYPVNARVKFDFSFTVVELAYEYEFLKRDSFEVGASLGVHYTQFSAALKAKASESGGTLEFDQRDEASVDAPLPVIGLQGTWKLPYDLWLNASGQFFALSIAEYDGDLQDYRATLTWQPKPWLGLGVGYDRFSVNVDVKRDAFKGSLDWTYDGPMVFYNASF